MLRLGITALFLLVLGSSSYGQLNTTYEVGSTAGSADVSPSGAATYSIPIFCAPGTAGMQPSISINYSSQAGNGNLGIGWDISGLSAIARVSQNFYNDVVQKGLQFTNEDKFTLDGMRLIPISGANGANNTEYRTEVENFNKITSYSTVANGSPNWFMVEDKNGSKIEYGNTANSAVETPNSTTVRYIWRINKITDANGNYMTFTYAENNGESYITQIDYTGNANTTPALLPYNKVVFTYEDRPDPQMAYINGNKLLSTKRLLRIESFVETNTTPTRKYVCTYLPNSSTSTPTSVLNSMLDYITEYDKDGKQYNPIKIQWGKRSYVSDAKQTNLPSQSNYKLENINNDLECGQANVWSNNPRIVFGDFNGDGKSDKIRMTKVLRKNNSGFLCSGDNESNYQSMTMQLGLGNGQFDSDVNWAIFPENNPNYSSLPTNVNQIFSSVQWHGVIFEPEKSKVVDLNGDGKQDLILRFAYYDSNGEFFNVLKDLLTLNFHPEADDTKKFFYKVLISNGTWFSEIQNDFYAQYTYDYVADPLQIGDFDGDGNIDVAVWQNCANSCNPLSTPSKVRFYTFNRNSNGSTTLIFRNEVTEGAWLKSLSTIDFDGDGATEIVRINTSDANDKRALAILRVNKDVNNNFLLTKFYDVAYTANEEQFTFADFNGDGKTDFLISNTDTLSTIYISNGINQYIPNQILLENGLNNNSLAPLSYLPSNPGIFDDKKMDAARYMPVDANNDGKTDIVSPLEFDRLYYSPPCVHVHDILYKIYPYSRLFSFKHYDFANNRLVYRAEWVPNNTDNKFSSLSQNLPLDINGDGNIDFVSVFGQDEYDISYREISPNDTSALVTGITDGLGKKVAWEYAHLSENKVYEKGSSPNNYPIINIQPTAKVVRKAVVKSGVLSTLGTDAVIDSTMYKYYDLKMHIRGKGNMGFSKIEKYKINHLGDKDATVDEFDIYTSGTDYNSAIFATRPTRSYRYINTPTNLVSESIYSTEVVILNLAQKRYYTRPTQTIEKNYLTNTTKTTTYSNYDAWGNALTVTTNFGGSAISVENVVMDPATYNLSPIAGMPTRIKTKTSTVTYTGKPAYTRSIDYEYDAKGNVKKEIADKGTAKAVTKLYEAVNANVALLGIYEKTTVSTMATTAINGTIIPAISRSTKAEFLNDTKYRFPTKITDALGYFISKTYDNSTGNVLTETGITGLTTTYTYDGFGRKKTAQVPVSQSGSTINYVTATTQYLWHTPTAQIPARYYTRSFSSVAPTEYTQTYFDDLGRGIRNETPNGLTGTDKLIITTLTNYDKQGRVWRTSDPLETGQSIHWNVSTYDTYGRLTSGNVQTQTATYTYNYQGNPKRAQVVKGTRFVTKTSDDVGNIIQHEDEGGTITYSYNSMGKPITTTYGNGGTTITNTYDAYGMQTSLNDPNTGLIQYDYNALGEIVYQKNYRNNIEEIAYDAYGRLFVKKETDATTNAIKQYIHVYETSNNGKGKIKEVNLTDGAGVSLSKQSYTYNMFGQVLSFTETVNGQTFTTTYTYDNLGHEQYTTYPGNTVKIERKYNANSRFYRIDRVHPTTNAFVERIWELKTEDAKGHSLLSYLGNTTKPITLGAEYDADNYLVRREWADADLYVQPCDPATCRLGSNRIATDMNAISAYSGAGNQALLGPNDPPAPPAPKNILDMYYEYNNTTLNMMQRKSVESNYYSYEAFMYDVADRLKGWTLYNGATGTMTYNFNTTNYTDNGNISSKTDAGTNFVYNTGTSNGKVNALAHITGYTANIPEIEQNIKYNAFEKAYEITEGTKKYQITYGPDRERIMAAMYTNNALTYTHYYSNSYEKRTQGANTTEWFYIAGADGLCAIITKQNTASPVTHFAVTDYQGSLMSLLTYDPITTKYTIAQENSYDAWGRRRSTASWAYYLPNTMAMGITARSYTGQEYLPEFGLYNLNGRMYDPVVARMLAPDNYITDGGTQGLNRYSYALNNPMKYIDPDGNHPILVAMAVGIAVNSAMYTYKTAASYGGFNNWNFNTFATSNVMAAMTSAVSFGIGSGVGSIGGAIEFGKETIGLSLLKATIQATAHGVSGGSFSALQGGSFGSGFASSAVGSLIGSATGGITNSDIWAVKYIGGGSIQVFSGGITSVIAGGDFMDGAAGALIGYLTNHAAHGVIQDDGGGNNMKLPPSDKKLPGFPNAKFVKELSSIRDTWITKDGEVLQWDFRHGEVEKYRDFSKQKGTHMGSFNPNTGKAMPNSKIYPNRVPQFNKSISWGYVKSLFRKAEPLIEKTLPAIERGSRLLDKLFLPLHLLQLSPGFQIQMQIYQNQNSTEIY